MRLKFENEILDPSVRKRLIQEIESGGNHARKVRAWKRYQCYKDNTKEFVLDKLSRQFDRETVNQMAYAISNISFVRKAIDKLSRVYSNGADREIGGSDVDTKKLQDLSRLLDIQATMKKANRFLKLQKNIGVFAKPCPIYDVAGNVEEWATSLDILQPFLFDVVEDEHQRTKPLVFILSDYKPSALDLNPGLPVNAMVTAALPVPPTGETETPKCSDKTYVFWSKFFHFTTDENGEIIQDPGNPQNLNPFGVCPIVSYGIDQDDCFWAEGGDDLVDGGILLNALISHTIHVGVVQGYGQFYATGKNVPRKFDLGPLKAIVAEYNKDEDPEPKLGFLQANPQLDSLRGLVEMYIALLLTTNNLSTSGVATQLSSGAALPSGIALMIDKAESLEDVQDQRQIFIDNEPKLFLAINAQTRAYGAMMSEDRRSLLLAEGFEKTFSVKFHDSQSIMSESEKLGNLKIRKELGLDSSITLLMKDDPNLTEETAEQKLRNILEQRIEEKMLQIELEKASGLADTKVGAGDVPSTDGSNSSTDTVGASPDAANPKVQDTQGTPTVGTTAAAPDQNVQQLALNGAQVTALVDMVEKVAAGTLPRESAVNMIVVAFNVTPEDANKILGSAGQGFKIARDPAPAANPPPTVPKA